MLIYSECLVSLSDPICSETVNPFIVITFGSSTHPKCWYAHTCSFNLFLFRESKVRASQHQWAFLQSILLQMMIDYFLLKFLCTHALSLRLALVENYGWVKRRPSSILAFLDTSLLWRGLHWLYHLLGRWVVFVLWVMEIHLLLFVFLREIKI
jgi:hypothetical protein